MSQFFISPELIHGSTVNVTGSEAHHILHTRRVQKGETCKFTDGCGYQYIAKLVAADKKNARLEIISRSEKKPLSTIGVALPLIDFTRLEWALEKCVELGCADFYFLTTDRTQLTLRFDTAEKKRLRWHRICLEAAKQCELCYVPEIHPVYALKDFLKEDLGQALVFWESANATDRRLPMTNDGKKSTLIFGPEGGFSPEEVKLFQSKNIPLLSLGPQVLRTETAAVVGYALCQNHLA